MKSILDTSEGDELGKIFYKLGELILGEKIKEYAKNILGKIGWSFYKIETICQKMYRKIGKICDDSKIISRTPLDFLIRYEKTRKKKCFESIKTGGKFKRSWNKYSFFF